MQDLVAYLHFRAGVVVDEEARRELVGLIGWMWMFTRLDWIELGTLHPLGNIEQNG